MSYKPPSIRDIGLNVHVEELRPTSNGHGYTLLASCFEKGLSDTAIGRLFNKNRKTIAGWRRIYQEGKS